MKRTPLAKVGVRIDRVGTTEVEAAFIDSDAVSVIFGEADFFDAHRTKFEKSRDFFEITTLQ